MAKKNNEKKYETEYRDDLIPEKAEKPAKVEKEKKSDSNSLALKITALSLAAVTVVMLVVGLVLMLGNNNIKLDYMKDNLGKYIVLDEDDYKNFPAEINVSKPTRELDVENAVLKALYANREEPDGDLPYVKNVDISAGDAVNIYYRGYTLTEDGKKEYFDGGCNFNSTKPTSLALGSGSFIPGFELNLVGKNQKNYATFEKISEGFVREGDIILITYSVYRGDGGLDNSKSAIIDLSDPNLDAKWGGGFADYWKPENNKIEINKNIESITVTSVTDGAKEDVYSNVKVTEIYRIDKSEEKPVLEVEAYFPNDYQKEDLQGKTAYFETFILSLQDYTVPTLDDKFITETLKLTADDLSSYAGETLVDKYKSKLYSDLEEEYRLDVQNAVATVFWDYVLEAAEFKKLPKGDVQSYYNSLFSQIEAAYPQYQSSYNTIDEFARAYLGLDSKADWEAAILKDAENSVKQKLAFYYIIREENFIPSDSEYQALYDELYEKELQTYLDYYGIKETDEDYAEKLQSAKDTIDGNYTESYWETQIMFEYGIEKICALAKITNKADK